MKKLISSFAVIGVLALSLIGGPAMASPSTPPPCPDVSVPEVTLPPCPSDFCTVDTIGHDVIDVPASPAVTHTEYEFVHKDNGNGNSDDNGNGNSDKTRWESDPNWNANSNSNSRGWTSTGNTRQVVDTPAVPAQTHKVYNDPVCLIPVKAPSPTVQFEKCGTSGTVIPPVVEGVVYNVILGSAGMHHITYRATALPGHVLVDSNGAMIADKFADFYLGTLAPECPKVETPPVVVTPVPPVTAPVTPPAKDVAPVVTNPVPAAQTVPVNTTPAPTELAYTGAADWVLPVGATLAVVGLMGIFIARRPNQN